MTDVQLLRHVAGLLRAVSDGNYPEDWCLYVGLCDNIGWVLDAEYYNAAQYDDVVRLVEEGMLLWPDSTGNEAYPVPGSPDAVHGSSLCPPVAAWLALAAACYDAFDNLYTGTYGKSRRALAAWLADYLESRSAGL